MENFKLVVMVLFFSACSLIEKQNKLVVGIRSTWLEKSVNSISQKPYFSSLVLKKEKDQITYIRRGKFPTGAYCQSLGGCEGMQFGDCYHVFQIKNEVIKDYFQQGNCQIDNQDVEQLKY